MREILGEREGVQVVGDRFVFPSEVLFAPGSATLGAAGQAQVARVAQVIREIADQIPPEINWILRVDGHTDKTPVSADSPFRRQLGALRGPRAVGGALHDRRSRACRRSASPPPASASTSRSTPATAPRRWRATAASS